MLSLFKQKKQLLTYDQIVSWDNMCQAYLDLYYILTEKCKGQRYKGVDGVTLHNIEPEVEEIIREAQDELIKNEKLLPARYFEIPKPDGNKRGIFLLSIKDRIKCQAIYRVLEPYFEQRYSDNLYSFRSSHPSYYASRSVRRFYLRNLGKKMYMFRADLTKYSDNFDRDYLYNVLKGHGIENDVIGLIKNVIKQPHVKNGRLVSNVKGVYQGMSFCPLFSNVYIGHMDDYISKRVDFYRRLGDDFIIFDKDLENLKNIKAYIEKEIKKAKLILNEEKQQFGNINETKFDFHGLQYNKGIIQLKEKKIESFLKALKLKLKYNKNANHTFRINKLRDLLNLNARVKNHYFSQFLKSYLLITDTKQIQNFSKRFFHVLTKYFTGKTTYKSMNQTKKILKNHKFPSLTAIHTAYSNGKNIKLDQKTLIHR